MWWRLFALIFLLFFGFAALWGAARASRDEHLATEPIKIEQRTASPVVLIFIDSLSRDVATDAHRMPYLSRLAREGTSFDVEPCRDQLTYLCLRAALTGHDESSLLAIRDNFRPEHEGPPDTLFSALAARGERVSVTGSNDFHPYRRALFVEHALSKTEETPSRVGALLAKTAPEQARLVVISLSSGDMVAHAHGVSSPEYREAFARIDRIVETVASALPPDAHLVVFGDHGHDALGRHLPGTWQKTWAVYRGAAFHAGAHHSLHITDHRALLGVLLGVPSEASYRGPPLGTIFDGTWVGRVLPRGLPPLEAAHVESAQVPALRWGRAIGLALLGLGGYLLLLRRMWARQPVTVAALLTLIAAVTGLGYDALRRIAHDHGDSPERALVLLAPLSVGIAGAVWLRRGEARGFYGSRPLALAAACIVGVTWLTLLPTSYYYGARRAVVLASILALVPWAFDRVRRGGHRFDGLVVLLASLSFVAAALASLYPVRQLGPETAQAATWALDAKLYQRWPWFALVIAKALIYALVVAPRAARRPLDSAGAAGLFTATVLIELASARMPREGYAALFVAIAVGAIFARQRAPSTLLAGSFLLLDHLYGANPTLLAPIEMILAATATAVFLWRRFEPNRTARAWLMGATVALASYLMLWPSVGFHLAGIDFGFMFQWVPEAQYQRAWQLIALGVVLKVGLPIVLVVAVGRESLREEPARLVVALGLSAKAALLAVLVSFFAVNHPVDSQQATAMLAELVLVMFAASCALAALPSGAAQRKISFVQAALQPSSETLLPSSHSS